MQIDVSHMNEKRSGIPPITQRHRWWPPTQCPCPSPQPRNLTDQQLRAIRDSGGVVGVNFGNAFLRADGRRDSDTPLTTIVRHIDYLINIMGEDHVALGSILTASPCRTSWAMWPAYRGLSIRCALAAMINWCWISCCGVTGYGY